METKTEVKIRVKIGLNIHQVDTDRTPNEAFLSAGCETGQVCCHISLKTKPVIWCSSAGSVWL